MITHLLDTNACVHHLRDAASPVSVRLAASPPGSIALCSVVVAELLYGAERSRRPAENRVLVQTFCSGFHSFPFDDRAAEVYGGVRRELERAGTPIGPHDLLIASIALGRDLTLVTNNTGEFGRIAGLRLEDWRRP